MNFKTEIEKFSLSSLRATTTTVTHADGSKWIEKGNETVSRLAEDKSCTGFIVDTIPDLQIGCILPNLLLASVDVARDIDLLTSRGVTHILNVAGDSTYLHVDKFIYKHIDILDLPEVDITTYFDECFQFIDSGLQTDGCVLVHCMLGVSRSAAIVIGYLIKHHKMTFDMAYSHVKLQRPSIQPNSGFLKQLRHFEQLQLS